MEDVEIWEAYSKTKDPLIREQLITKYSNLIKLVAGRMNIYTGSVIDYEDLLGYGVFGLIDAIDKFDYTKGYKFETYASLRIKGEIIDNIRKMDWIPRTIRQKTKLLESAISTLELKNDREPTIKEIATEMNISKDEVYEYLKSSELNTIVSLDGYLEQGYEKTSTSLVDNKQSGPDKELERKENKEALVEAIKNLTEKQQLVITLYYYEELTLKEISKILEISESRVSQIHSSSIRTLKKYLGNKFIELSI